MNSIYCLCVLIFLMCLYIAFMIHPNIEFCPECIRESQKAFAPNDFVKKRMKGFCKTCTILANVLDESSAESVTESYYYATPEREDLEFLIIIECRKKESDGN